MPIGLCTSIIVFFIIRVVDEEFLNSTVRGGDIEDFVASSVRPILAVFASMTIGAVVARRGLLVPAVTLVAVVWAATLANTYAHRDDYVTSLRLIDLDWAGAVMAIATTIIAVKTGEWIARSMHRKPADSANA